ncbi:hypothetical protein AHAS_Ahas13G0191000 [Arachis hypogaea]
MDTILVSETPLFAHIRDQIHMHFESKRGKIKVLNLMGEAYNTFFSARHGPSSLPYWLPHLALFLHLSKNGLLSILNHHKS